MLRNLRWSPPMLPANPARRTRPLRALPPPPAVRLCAPTGKRSADTADKSRPPPPRDTAGAGSLGCVAARPALALAAAPHRCWPARASRLKIAPPNPPPCAGSSRPPSERIAFHPIHAVHSVRSAQSLPARAVAEHEPAPSSPTMSSNISAPCTPSDTLSLPAAGPRPRDGPARLEANLPPLVSTFRVPVLRPAARLVPSIPAVLLFLLAIQSSGVSSPDPG